MSPKERTSEYLLTTLHGTDWGWYRRNKLAILTIEKGERKGNLIFWNNGEVVDFSDDGVKYTIDEAETIAFCRPLIVKFKRFER